MMTPADLDKVVRRAYYSPPFLETLVNEGPRMDKQTLQKMTVLKLREEALKIEGVSGVHGMNKQQLLAALFDHFGIPQDQKVRRDLTTLKQQIKKLRTQQAEVRPTGDKKKIKVLRRRIHSLRRATRV
jgi:hypothetical protein